MELDVDVEEVVEVDGTIPSLPTVGEPVALALVFEIEVDTEVEEKEAKR